MYHWQILAHYDFVEDEKFCVPMPSCFVSDKCLLEFTLEYSKMIGS